MGLGLEIGVTLRKIVLISYRSVCNHPFLAGMLLFLLFLYRSFPFLFTLLVSTSPVLVCTAVVLGTLLSFGQTNIPEIEREEKVDVASLRTRGLGDDTVVLERGGSFSTERFVGETRDFVDASIEKASSEVEDRDGLGVYVPLISEDLQNTDSEERVNEDCDGSVVYVPLIDQDLQNIGGEKREIEDAERELDSSELGERRKIDNDHLGIEGIDWDVAAVDQQYTFFQKVQDEIRRVEDDDISPRGSGYAHEGDHLYSSLLGNGGGDDVTVEQQYTSFQKVRNEIRRVEDDDISPRGSGYAHDGDHLYSSLLRSGGDDEAGEDVDDEASDSDSDRAESSSPDASMADILPMLDELHPLLDSEAPQPAHVSHGHESDAASDQSNGSNAGSVDSDVETENHGGEVGEDRDDYNDGDKEEAPDGKDDESKSAIKWTEDDQKNLMDLGNLELERNRRLENLIARRRARKSFKITAEKNLIDFDSVDLPFNVAPISTARHNPFDLPYDSFDNLGLPPIPGSAPSVMLPRRNPFDLPYESNEEKPDLKGDPFEQEFMPIHARDAIFRRHESFNLGPSTLGQPRHERQDFKWRPVFVPERLASEGTSSSLFQRQLSEISESKLSSVPDTESVSSAADLDERNFSEQDFTKEAEVISNIYHATDDLVEHGSQSSEVVDSLEMEQAGKRDVQHNELEIKLVESQDLEPSLSGATGLATHVEHVNEDHFKPEPIEEDNRSTPGLSSLTEEDEKIADVVEGGSTSLEARGDIAKEFVISLQPSLKESEVQFVSRTLNEDEHDEPVYDSTPLPTEKILSFNSISSDIQADVSEMVTPPALAEVQVPFVDRDCEVYGESTDKDTPGFVETSGATSKVHASDEIERSLGTGNQVGLAVSHSEDDISLPKIFDMKTADCSYQSVLSEEQPSSELDKVLSWSDKSMVEPYLDDHVEALIIKEVDDIKEIDAGLLSELDAVGDFSANEVVGEALHTEELIPEEANVLSTEFGDLNLSELNQELPVVEARSIENIDTDFKQIRKGLAVEEVVLPSVVDDQLVVEASKNNVQASSELPIIEKIYLEDSDSELPTVEERYLEASENTVQTSSELPIVEASYLEDNVTDLKQDSEGNVNELPQVSEDNNVGELSNGSEEVGTTSVDSTEVLASSNTVSSVQEDTNADTALEQVLESHVDELPKATSISNDGSEEVQCNTMGSLDEMASSNILSGFQENITTPKQVSDSHVNDGSEVGTGAIGSTEDIASSNTVSSVQEDTNADTALEQVSESHVDELAEATSISDDASEEVGIGAISSTEEVASSDSVQEDMNADTALEKVSESHVTELPKVMSVSIDGFEGGTGAVGPAEEIASSNMLSSVHEDITTPKHISESHVNDGAEEIGTNSMGSTEEIASSDMLSSVQENSTLEQVSEIHVDELLKRTSHLKERLLEMQWRRLRRLHQAPQNMGVQEAITSPIAFEQVSGSNVDGEPPKPSTHNILAEVVPHATDLPVENVKHEN